MNVRTGVILAGILLLFPVAAAQLFPAFGIPSISGKVITTPEESPLHISLAIPRDYSEIEAGDDVLASIKIINVRGQDKVDVLMAYEISEKSGHVILTQKETIAVETQANLVRIFNIPSSAKSGKYLLKAFITYDSGKTAEAESSFTLLGKSEDRWKEYLMIAAMLCILALSIVSVRKMRPFFERVKMRNQIQRIVRKRLAEAAD